MVKLIPEERWRRIVRERYTALELSGELKPLRRQGLAILGRQRMLTGDGWNRLDLPKLIALPKFVTWYSECEEVATRFGLDTSVVLMACLLKSYSPEDSGLTVEASWPMTRVVTNHRDPLFLQWLCYQAQLMGLHVIHRSGSTETTIIHTDPAPPSKPLSESSRPPRATAFQIRLETPPDYPPEAAAQLLKSALKMGQELYKNLGYPYHQRLRPSLLVTKAKLLKTDKARLTEKESQTVINKMFPKRGEQANELILHKQSKSQKHKMRNRLVKPYLKPPESPVS